jgi:hypothetical protein
MGFFFTLSAYLFYLGLSNKDNLYNKIKKRDNHEGFALVPFISIGMMAVFFI